jgi:glycosyltransferase involved in cell wall biosynthesis
VVRKKILIVAMLDSIHTARWLKQFKNDNFDFVLFPSTPNRRIHPEIAKLINESSNSAFMIIRTMKYLSLPLCILDLIFKNRIRGYILQKVVDNSSTPFSMVHAHEIQHAGYLVFEALSRTKQKPLLILSIWGSDIFWFKQFPSHRKKITQVLSMTNQLICECTRDIESVKQLGYRGKNPVIMSASGGFDFQNPLHTAQKIRPSERNLILIKGYMGFVGRADLALRALSNIALEIRNQPIIVYSSDFRSRRIARHLMSKHGLNITCYKKRQLSHEKMLSLFSDARVHIGMSESDGLPGSLRESMFCGCFPIQTDTSCADEWITDGISGYIVPINDEKKLQLSIQHALRDNELVDNAAILNIASALQRLNGSSITKAARFIYLNN